jgi:hypothetical protein
VAENLLLKGCQWKLQKAKFAEKSVQQFRCIYYFSDKWADMTSHKKFFHAIQTVPNITHMTSLIIQVEIYVHSTVMTNPDYAAQ